MRAVAPDGRGGAGAGWKVAALMGPWWVSHRMDGIGLGTEPVPSPGSPPEGAVALRKEGPVPQGCRVGNALVRSGPLT
ncbi:hypothetical protein GCM10010254_51940 [Streptomyces chromofuscus]|nr:hypothetical protein GCM10010254_51940 [Streptomyces chromofuscus]